MHCQFCGKTQYPQIIDAQFQNGLPGETSTVVLAFDSGRVYRIPAHMDHVIIAHEYQPPTSFVGDIMNSYRIPLGAVHPAIAACPTELKIGVNFNYGAVPAAMPYRLREYIRAAVAEAKNEPVAV